MKKLYTLSLIYLFLQISSFGQASDFKNVFINSNLKQLENDSLTETNFIDLANGKTIVLTSLNKGCKWILEEMAYYNKLKIEYPEQFEVFITFYDDITTMSKYIQGVNFDFIYIYDPMKTLCHKFYKNDTICSVLFDSNGFIQEKTNIDNLNRDKILVQLKKNKTKSDVKKNISLPILNLQLKRYELGDKVSSNLVSVNIPTKIMTGYKVGEFSDTIENVKFCTLSGENILGLYSYAYDQPKSRFVYDKKIEYINSHAPNHRYTLSLTVSKLHADFKKMLIKQIDLNFGLETSQIIQKKEVLILSKIDLKNGKIGKANSLDKNKISNENISETTFKLAAANIKAIEIAKLIEEKTNFPVELNFNPKLSYSLNISIENKDRTIENWIKLFSENGLILKKKMKKVKCIKIKTVSH